MRGWGISGCCTGHRVHTQSTRAFHCFVPPPLSKTSSPKMRLEPWAEWKGTNGMGEPPFILQENNAALVNMQRINLDFYTFICKEPFFTLTHSFHLFQFIRSPCMRNNLCLSAIRPLHTADSGGITFSAHSRTQATSVELHCNSTCAEN